VSKKSYGWLNGT